jgi:Ca-activated chloride channel family protein
VPFLGSSAVVLLTDGEDTTENDPVAVADVAGRAGVRIFTVGVGSAEGAVVDVGGFRVATALDEERLRAIASASNGAYYSAERERQLRRVYDSIDLKLTVRGEKTEITALLAGAALIVFLVAAWLSFRWLGRAP